MPSPEKPGRPNLFAVVGVFVGPCLVEPIVSWITKDAHTRAASETPGFTMMSPSDAPRLAYRDFPFGERAAPDHSATVADSAIYAVSTSASQIDEDCSSSEDATIARQDFKQDATRFATYEIAPRTPVMISPQPTNADDVIAVRLPDDSYGFTCRHYFYAPAPAPRASTP